MVDIDCDDTSDNQTTWPSSVKDIQPLGFFFAEHRGDDWIDECFNRSVAKSQNQATPIEKAVAKFPKEYFTFVSNDAMGLLKERGLKVVTDKGLVDDAAALGDDVLCQRVST